MVGSLFMVVDWVFVVGYLVLMVLLVFLICGCVSSMFDYVVVGCLFGMLFGVVMMIGFEFGLVMVMYLV